MHVEFTFEPSKNIEIWMSYDACKFMVFLGHQVNLAEISTFEQIIAPSNLNIFARFKGGFNMHFSLLSNTKLKFCQKKLFVELENWVRQRYPP